MLKEKSTFLIDIYSSWHYQSTELVDNISKSDLHDTPQIKTPADNHKDHLAAEEDFEA